MNKKYENEIKVFEKYFHHLNNQDNILHQIRSYKILHGGGHRYENKNKELHSPIKELSTTIFYKYDEIKNFELEIICEKVYDMVVEKLGQIKKMMFDGIINITELTGNQIDAKGKGISPELILNMLEQIEITFDENGNPNLPTLNVSPKNFRKIKDLKYNPEQEKRHNEIIEAKRKKWYAKKRYRKLSYID